MLFAQRVRVRALQTSGVALAMAMGGPAFAQCAPEPTQTNGTTTCTGTDVNGVTVTTYGTTVSVPVGATVLGGTQPGVAIRLPSNVSGSPVTVSVAGRADGAGGRIDGGTQAGVSLLWQAPTNAFGFATANIALTVGQNATVTGANALVVGQATAAVGNAYATIDNSGTLSGTSGIALLSTSPMFTGFSTITNRATGTIGAIVGPVGTLTNLGTIDGGTRSAIDWTTTQNLFGTVTNSGAIASTGTAATLANLASGRTIVNSGTITNRGTGAAIAGDGYLLTNTGRITTTGATAIQSNTYLTLTNTGTITGNVATAVQPAYTANSTIDSSAGTINGSVTFGAGDDTLVAGWNGALVTGITGAISGGAGTHTLRVKFTADASVGSSLTLPTAFERLSLAPDAKVTATLVNGFSAPGPIAVSGNGTVVNRTTLTGTTQAVVANDFSSTYPTFVNAGTIRTTAGTSGTYAVVMGFNVNRFENGSVVEATGGDGVSFSSQGTFANTATGTITATGTGVSLFGPSFSNEGTIRSATGTGVVLSGSSGSNWTNSGRIEGAAVGARISSYLVNTGLITSPGIGVALDSYGVLLNRGTVTGGVAGTSNFLFNATIANAGTINGNVRLTGSASNGSFNANRYFALAGGTLNGNLSLGASDVLVAEIANTGTGAFAGITGTVTASGALLRYRVRTDASATLSPPAGFAGVGYDLYDNAALTLTGSASQVAGSFIPPVTLAGQGSVDLNATITGSSQPLIQVTSLLTAPGETAPTTSGLAITSRGALTLDRPNGAAYPYAAVSLTGNDSFTNTGTITVRERSTKIFSQMNAIAGGKSVTNSGSIVLDAATGVNGAQAFTNSGSITQATGGRASTGVTGVGSFTNTATGTVDVAGNAVLTGYGNTVVNAGKLTSSGTAAIAALNGSSYGATITNQAGGTISGAGGQAAVLLAGGTLSNAGTITGSVDLGYAGSGSRSFAPATYVANGGTITGNLRFGAGYDTLVAVDDVTGVSGTIDGGDGLDTFVHARATSGTVTLGTLNVTGFELEGVRAIGASTVATIAAPAAVAGDVYVSGDGGIVNTATLNGAVYVGSYTYDPLAAASTLASFTNSGTVAGGFSGSTASFANTGSVGSATLTSSAVSIDNTAVPVTFTNSSRIANDGSSTAVDLLNFGSGSITASNSGTIAGGLSAYSYIAFFPTPADVPASTSVSLVNTGTITRANATAVDLGVNTGATPASVTLDNRGTIEATGTNGIGAFVNAAGDPSSAAQTLTVTNSGTIRAAATNGVGLLVNTNAPGTTATITNAAGGTIEATGGFSTALFSYDAGLNLSNAGTIRGIAGTVLPANSSLAGYLGAPYLAGAIQTAGGADDRIVNTGTITGSIALGTGSDRIENRGRIEGDVFLGTGDDIFLQLASATLIGTVDGGAGTDSLIVDAIGGGSVNGDQFVNFERFSQVGNGSVAYTGTFRADTIGVSGGSATVAAGQTLASSGPVTITGSDASETVTNNGTIAGSVSLAGGNDRFVNNGAVGGSVSLGDGDDEFVDGAGSSVTDGVDGGAGSDLYTVALAGNRSGIGQRTGFERLGVTGTGTLSLTLDQDFTSLALAGTGLNLTLAGRTISTVTGSDAAETLAVDGDLANVSLGAGDDTLSLGGTRVVGRYEGGAGADTLRFTATAPVTLAGTATGFETLTLSGSALTVTGTLGSTGTTLSFGTGDQQLTLANGGTLAGTIDLGAGNDNFRLVAGGTINGSIAGGAGTDTATVELGGNRTLAGVLTGFETLTTEGTGTLTLTGTHAYDRVNASGDLSVGAGGSLTAGQVQFAAGNNLFTVAGRFAGAVDGSAGTDTLAVSGGSEAAPVAFTNVSNVEALAMSGGFATVSGTAAFNSVDMSGGRLVGLTGSTLTAAQFLVRQGATFGSAGTVNGNVTIAGILSPGASPGTMTVNGNVAIQSGSVSLFEITPTVADKLVVNGAVTIASGATLQLVPTGTLRPGTSYDLITATGGITGSYSTVVKPDSLFGFIVQRADRIQLLGQFLGNASFSPQVGRSIAYANATLAVQPATSSLFAALPSLLASGGASNPAAFARLTPEPYASATQAGVDKALTLASTARGPAFAATGEDTHAYTFAQTLGGWHRLSDDPTTGTAATRSRSYGFLGGVGIGNASWSVGAFAGYLNDRQRIDALGARTRADGVVAGVHGRYLADSGFGITASVLYDGGRARTDRALPGTAPAVGRYDLRSWVSDLSVSYGLGISSDWQLRPRAGVTYIRTTREDVAETGGSPFALTVARDRHVAGFADAGLSFARSETSAAPLRPFVSLGVRYQIEGTRTDALAGYAGGGLGLYALGAPRSRVVGTAAGGIGYRLSTGLDLFATAASQTGRDDHQESITAGVRLRF